MALALTALTSAWNQVDANSYATASVTIAANRGYLLVVGTPQQGANPTKPTVSGASVTWTEADDILWASVGTPRRRTTVFRCLNVTGGSGVLTIDYGGVTQGGCSWALIEITGMDTSGTNGSGMVVQVVKSAIDPSAATSGSISLAALGSANNVAFGAVAHIANEVTTPGAGYAELTDNPGNNPSLSVQTEYLINVTTVNASWATSSIWGITGIEIKAADDYIPRYSAHDFGSVTI